MTCWVSSAVLCWFRATTSIRSKWPITGDTLTSVCMCVFTQSWPTARCTSQTSEEQQGRASSVTVYSCQSSTTGEACFFFAVCLSTRANVVHRMVTETSKATLTLINHVCLSSYTPSLCLCSQRELLYLTPEASHTHTAPWHLAAVSNSEVTEEIKTRQNKCPCDIQIWTIAWLLFDNCLLNALEICFLILWDITERKRRKEVNEEKTWGNKKW